MAGEHEKFKALVCETDKSREPPKKQTTKRQRIPPDFRDLLLQTFSFSLSATWTYLRIPTFPISQSVNKIKSKNTNMSSYDSHASFEDAFDLLDEDRPEETVDGIAHKKIPESPQQTKSKIEHHRVNSDVSEVDKDILAQDETMKARIAQGYGPGNEIGG